MSSTRLSRDTSDLTQDRASPTGLTGITLDSNIDWKNRKGRHHSFTFPPPPPPPPTFHHHHSQGFPFPSSALRRQGQWRLTSLSDDFARETWPRPLISFGSSWDVTTVCFTWCANVPADWEGMKGRKHKKYFTFYYYLSFFFFFVVVVFHQKFSSIWQERWAERFYYYWGFQYVTSHESRHPRPIPQQFVFKLTFYFFDGIVSAGSTETTDNFCFIYTETLTRNDQLFPHDSALNDSKTFCGTSVLCLTPFDYNMVEWFCCISELICSSIQLQMILKLSVVLVSSV